LLGIEGPESKLFDIVIQLGAILAVCWVYRERFTRAALGLTSDPVSQRFVANVVIAFLPAAVAGVFAYRLIKEVLFDQMKLRTALGIGCCQILAMIPGVSRAGATIMGAMMLRVDRAAATQFSFFLALPTMLGATV
jgi:undecaprenyl-diphosphatase